MNGDGCSTDGCRGIISGGDAGGVITEGSFRSGGSGVLNDVAPGQTAGAVARRSNGCGDKVDLDAGIDMIGAVVVETWMVVLGMHLLLTAITLSRGGRDTGTSGGNDRVYLRPMLGEGSRGGGKCAWRPCGFDCRLWHWGSVDGQSALMPTLIKVLASILMVELEASVPVRCAS